MHGTYVCVREREMKKGLSIGETMSSSGLFTGQGDTTIDPKTTDRSSLTGIWLVVSDEGQH